MESSSSCSTPGVQLNAAKDLLCFAVPLDCANVHLPSPLTSTCAFETSVRNDNNRNGRNHVLKSSPRSSTSSEFSSAYSNGNADTLISLPMPRALTSSIQNSNSQHQTGGISADEVFLSVSASVSASISGSSLSAYSPASQSDAIYDQISSRQNGLAVLLQAHTHLAAQCGGTDVLSNTPDNALGSHSHAYQLQIRELQMELARKDLELYSAFSERSKLRAEVDSLRKALTSTGHADFTVTARDGIDNVHQNQARSITLIVGTKLRRSKNQKNSKTSLTAEGNILPQEQNSPTTVLANKKVTYHAAEDQLTNAESRGVMSVRRRRSDVSDVAAMSFGTHSARGTPPFPECSSDINLDFTAYGKEPPCSVNLSSAPHAHTNVPFNFDVDANIQHHDSTISAIHAPATTSSFSSNYSTTPPSVLGRTLFNPNKRIVVNGEYKGRWTKSEDDILRTAYEASTADGQQPNWSWIAGHINGRTGTQCIARWQETLDPTVRKGKWQPEEDELLIRGLHQHGLVWVKVAAMVPGRTQRQCRTRWTALRHLLPANLATAPVRTSSRQNTAKYSCSSMESDDIAE